MLTCHRQAATHAYIDPRLDCFSSLSSCSSIVGASAAPLALAASAQRDGGLPRATPEAVGMSSERLQSATAILRQYVADRKIAGARRRRGAARQARLPRAGRPAEPRVESADDRALAVPHLLDDQGGDRRRVMMLVEEGKLRAHRSRVEVPARVQERRWCRTAARARRAAVARDHHPGSAAAHVGPQPSHVGAVSTTARCARASIGLPQFVVNITKAPLLEDPGTRFRYSEATTVLGRIVEVVVQAELRRVRDRRASCSRSA